MRRYSEALIRRYFDENSIVASNIDSFNNFIDFELAKIIEENKTIEPTIIPHNIDEYKIKFDKIWVEKPTLTEADGSKKNILPIEARLRKITYGAPCFIEVSAEINGIQREQFVSQVGNLPIMLKSKQCHLRGLSHDELIKAGEDPNDPGGYFIINGTEKVLIAVEDLAANQLLIGKSKLGVSEFNGRLFSERGSVKIPHTFEKLKDGIFYVSFTRVKRIPIIVILKALGFLADEDIMKFISATTPYDEVIVNLYEFVDIKTQDDALDYIAKKIGITQAREIRVERMREILDRYLLPHLGLSESTRIYKAYNLCKLLKKFIEVSNGKVPLDDKDHYMNKRLKLAGDLLSDLFRVNLKVLVGDLLYNLDRKSVV